MTDLNNRYQIEQHYIKLGNARSGQKINKVLFLVAHETANPKADADDHFNYFNNTQPKASAHTFIDDTKILEIVPLNEKAFHVWYDRPLDNQLFGDDANDSAIGVELCRTGDFKKAYDRYVWYFAYLCKHFGLDPKKHIISHKKLDPARRSDPDSWLNPNGVTWENFINHVVSYYNQWDVKPTPAPTPAAPTPAPQPKVQAQSVTQYGLDSVPVKSPNTYRLAKFVDSADPKVIDQLKKDGFKIIAVPQ